MRAKGNHTSPISFCAQLTGLAGDPVFQLCWAGLEAGPLVINPGTASIIRWHHANRGETLTVPPAGLRFRITAEVYRKPGTVAPLDRVQIVDALHVVRVRERPQFGAPYHGAHKLLQHR